MQDVTILVLLAPFQNKSIIRLHYVQRGTFVLDEVSIKHTFPVHAEKVAKIARKTLIVYCENVVLLIALSFTPKQIGVPILQYVSQKSYS